MNHYESQCVSPFELGVDLTSPDLLERGLPLTELAQLRRTAPVWWNAEPDGSDFGDHGYWVLSRHADISAIFPDIAQWSSHENGAIIRLPEAVTPDQLDLVKSQIINQDQPEHTRLRKLLSRLFTPRVVNALEERLASAAHQIVRDALARGSGNFVEDVATKLPSTTIAELIGVPEEDRARVSEWVNIMANSDDHEVTAGYDVPTLQAEMAGYTYVMAEQRRACPRNDIVTRLISADADGDGLGEAEFSLFVILLAIAGSETTRNAITQGMNAFFEFPDQWDLFKNERSVTAVEEILRWSTPVHCLQRTATADVTLHDVTIRRGERIGLFLSSANYDDTVFDDPFRFNIVRAPNPHLTFGGHGIHYCLGANLARLEIRLIFHEIAEQMPDICRLAPPQRVRSGWMNGVRQLDVSYRGC